LRTSFIYFFSSIYANYSLNLMRHEVSELYLDKIKLAC
jgi:hypothetical protein